MTIDRTALRGLVDMLIDRSTSALSVDTIRARLASAAPDLLDELDAQDRRIAELESALRTALTGWRTNHLCEVDYSDEELARIDELQKLLPSEET